MTCDAIRERTAIHEAGHAMCAMLLGISFESVTVKPNGAVLGEVLSDGVCRYNPKSRADAMASAMLSLAGCVAEALHSCDVETAADGAVDDFDKADNALRAAFKTDKELLRRRSRAYSKTFKMLSRPETWAIVEKLAAALLERETLTLGEALDIALE